MSKIEEIIKNTDKGLYSQHLAAKIFGNNPWEIIIKQYAEMYAMKVLEVAAENANSKFIQDDRDLMNGGYQTIDKDSILNIKLPEHE